VSRHRIELLTAQMDEAYRSMRDRLDGIAEAEYFWEPVPGSWTVRRLPDGRWDYDYAIPDPDPAPFTTIAWRVNHLATCKVMYHEYAFGAGLLTWDTLETPPSMRDAFAMLERGHALLSDDLATRGSDDDLDRPVRTNWDEIWPAWQILWTMIHHDALHGGEIACLRDLYAHTVGGAAAG
jgi:hypothetical protein